MLDTVLADRYVLELPKPTDLAPKDIPIIIPRVPRTLVELLPEKKKPKAEPEKKEKTKAQKEISDAVSEVIEEMKLEVKPQRIESYDSKKAAYSLFSQDSDRAYQKVSYGDVAAPLATRYEHSEYKHNDDSDGFDET